MTEAEYLHEGLSKVFDLLPGNPEAALYHCRKYLAGSSVTEMAQPLDWDSDEPSDQEASQK